MNSKATFPAIFCLLSAACGLLPYLRDSGAQPPRSGDGTVEIRDEKGRVRCRLGKVSDKGYGLQIFGDDDSQRIEVGISDGLARIVGRVGATGPSLSMSVGSAGSEIVMGDLDGRYSRLNLSATGDCGIACGSKKGGEQLAFRSEPGALGRTSLVIHGPSNEEGRASGLAMIADSKGATLDLLQNGQSAAQLGSANGAMAYLLLGARRLGMYLQAAVNGDVLLEICNERPQVVLQSTSNGTGLALNRKDGNAAIRLGLSARGELRRALLDEDGVERPWDHK